MQSSYACHAAVILAVQIPGYKFLVSELQKGSSQERPGSNGNQQSTISASVPLDCNP